MNALEFKPQAGPQEQFLSSSADIAIYGGAAGGGKSFALLLDPVRNIENSLFRGVLFRREMSMITKPGGLWDESTQMYPYCGGYPANKAWTFPSGATLTMSHLNEENDKHAHQGAQYCYLGFDELTQFSYTQFFYLLSRLRSVSGIPGHVRGACNPDPDSWVASFISWWINQETGLAIPERSGKLRWFVKDGDKILWADSKEELIEKYGCPSEDPMSVTFIASKVQDNKKLMEKDPRYVSRLRALDRVDRARLLDGNWKIKASAGQFFQRAWFKNKIIDKLPDGHINVVRYWDKAATEPHEGNKDPDYTAGGKMYKYPNGTYVIADMKRDRVKPLGVEKLVKDTAKTDGFGVMVCIEQEPGSAGVADADNYVRLLAGYNVRKRKPTSDKVTRAKPLSAQAEAGNVYILRGEWNEDLLTELEDFDEKCRHDDQVDACSGAFNELCDNLSICDVL